MPIWLLLFVMALLGADDGLEDGRRGNALYEAGDYAGAAAAYRAGLERPAVDGALRWTLLHNLGLALHQQDAYDEAATAFHRAADAAETPARRAQALYNAGNNAVAQDQLEAALDRYRQALLADPSYADARFNYELLKRQLAERQAQQPEPNAIEPSDFARELKRRAEALASNRRYEDAYRLMQDGLQRDSTVAAFRSFIGRLSDVARIDTLSP